jgi:hypothetical protein
MAFEETAGEGPPPEESQNRTFIILAIALGGMFLVGLICIGVYLLVIGPQQRNRVAQTNQAVMTANAEVALQMTQAAQPTSTPTVDAAATSQAQLAAAQTQTAAVTPTQVVVLPTDTPAATSSPTNTLESQAQVTGSPSPIGPSVTPGGPTATRVATATPLVGALGTGTSTPVRSATPTQLPGTGFADEAGVPALILAGFALVAVVVIARRLRLSLR